MDRHRLPSIQISILSSCSFVTNLRRERRGGRVGGGKRKREREASIERAHISRRWNPPRETKTRMKFILMHIQDASFSSERVIHECLISFYRPLERERRIPLPSNSSTCLPTWYHLRMNVYLLTLLFYSREKKLVQSVGKNIHELTHSCLSSLF